MAKVDKNRIVSVDNKYRPLKKMMKKTSGRIADYVANRQLPSSELMEDFMAQAKVMVSYPGFGDDHYGAFQAACDALYKAYRKKDPVLFQQCFEGVISLKNECHHRYK